ncbi:MAG: hypothetical protein WD827_00555 [Solirubrobacterales bacterium]
MAAAATARQAAAPARAPRKKAPAPRKASLKVAPARRAPARTAPPVRRKVAPARRPAGQLIPFAVGTAAAVRHLPDSSLMVRMTRGRTWIAVLGLLLAGIVALNVVTLSLAASAGQIDQNIQALDQENSILRNRDAQKSASPRVRHDAAALGLVVANVDEVAFVEAGRDDVAIAAQRLAAADAGY